MNEKKIVVSLNDGNEIVGKIMNINDEEIMIDDDIIEYECIDENGLRFDIKIS